MVDTDLRLADRIAKLAQDGTAIRLVGTPPPHPDPGPYKAWRAQVLSTLVRSLGSEDVYTRHFDDVSGGFMGQSSRTAGVELLLHLEQDIRDGELRRLRDRVVAEVFADFLEMADYLLEQGFKDSAASLVGAVLEDSLRQALKARSVPFRDRAGLDELNGIAEEHGLYGAVQKGSVNGWRLLRNNADHGHFDQYSAEEVRLMLAGVRNLLGGIG